MGEEKRRFDDTIAGKMAKLWPILLALALLGASYVRNDQKLADTANLAKETASKVSVLERKVDVQTELLSDIRDMVKEMARRQ